MMLFSMVLLLFTIVSDDEREDDDPMTADSMVEMADGGSDHSNLTISDASLVEGLSSQ